MWFLSVRSQALVSNSNERSLDGIYCDAHLSDAMSGVRSVLGGDVERVIHD